MNGLDFLCAELPKFVLLRIVFKSGFLQPFYNFVLADIQVGTKRIQRWIKVSELHIDDAEQHHRVFRQFHNSFDSYSQTAAKLAFFGLPWHRHEEKSLEISANFPSTD